MQVFISSTYRDLVDHRRAVIDVLLRLKLQPIAMEFFGADPDEPKRVCADEIQDCELFIGLYAHRYGFIPEGDEKSITEQEFDLARELGKLCFCYVVDEDHPWRPKMIEGEPGKSKLAAFKARLEAGLLVRDTFTTPDNLALKVASRLGRWLAEHGQPVPGFLPSLLTVEEFAARAEQAALISHKGAVVGREQILDQISSYLEGLSRIIILHGRGGIGKTRLLLALPEVITEDTQLWYTRTEAETIERDLATLDRNRQHVIVVDDTHRFAPLPHLREVLINPNYAGKVKLVLSTRSVFSEYVTFRFPQIPSDQIAYLELGPLTNADIDHLLRNDPCNITDKNVRRTLITAAEGSPLIAQLGARLAQRSGEVVGLTRDEVLTHYFDELIHDLAEIGYDDRYVRYLEVLAALGTLDMSNEALRQRVQEVVGISSAEEERIVARLVGSGLVERYWKTLKIASEVLADHILVSHFFDPKTRRADYQRQILEPLLPLKAKEILTNLAEAEVKGESREAGVLLGYRLDELYQTIGTQGNIARYAILDWLQDVAYLKADETLAIVARIVDGEEQPAEAYRDRWWGAYQIGHDMVLDKAVEILSRCKYGALRDTIVYLHKLARYRPDEKSYDQVREKARKALVEIAEFRPRQPYAVQLTLLESIPRWLAQDFAGNRDVALALLEPMLSIALHGAETDPTEPSKVVFRRGVLNPAEPLKHIREQALGILYNMYPQATSAPERLRIVRVLDGAAPFLPGIRVPDETMEWLRPDCVNTACFFSETVIEKAELPVLDAISMWLRRARRWAGYEDEALDRLGEQLKSHHLYQLYRLLIGWDRWDEDEIDEIIEEELDWRDAERRHQEAVERYLGQLKSDTFDETIRDLETIAYQAHSVGETGTNWFNRLLQRLGEEHPDLAQQLIDHAIAEELTLKHHLGLVVAGLRKSTSEIAEGYLRRWITSDDTILWLATAHSYRFVDWAQMKTEGWEILGQLVAHDSPAVDHEVVWLTRRYASYNPDLAVEVMRTMATRGDKAILQRIADVLSWSNDTREGWAIEFENPQDYLEIIQNFERLPYLDFHVERCLDRLGQIAPMHVMDFIEQRITVADERKIEDEQYTAVPFQFTRPMDSIRNSAEYTDVLRRARDWVLRDDFSFRWESPHVLKAISGGLDETLHAVLMEWVESGEVEKLQGVAAILREFNEGGAFYDLSREIIRRTDDERVLSSIGSAISSTPGIISGPMSAFYQKRLEAISPWIEDEDSRVRRFANRIANSLQATIEREQAEEELERRSW
jgi:hypothetical protein